MNEVLEAYNLEIDGLINFFRKVNEPITYPDGMVTSLGIVYWGRDEHFPSFEDVIPRLKAERMHRFGELLESIRTPGQMKKFAQRTGIPGDILRILKHDIELWTPKPVPFAAIELLQKYPEYLEKFASAGIGNQLQVISRGQTPQSRQALSERTGIPLDSIEEMVKCCDVYRMGSNLKHIRTRIYYEIGLDTWQKWASATSEEIIERFSEHITSQGLEEVRLAPWPKEVRNGIEWAKYHLSIYAVEW